MIKPSIIRYFFIAITFLGSFSTYPKAVPAAHAEETGTIDGEIIEISTPEDFQNINNDLTAHYEIVNDIDFEGFELTQIASNENLPFEGVLDGKGFKLENIVIPYSFTLNSDSESTIERFYSHSLIEHNNGVIKNITFHNISHSPSLSLLSSNYAYRFSILNNNYGFISNIFVKWIDQSITINGDSRFLSFSFFSIYNSGTIEKISVAYGTSLTKIQIFSLNSGSFSGISIFNSGIINQAFVNLEFLIKFQSPFFSGTNFLFSGASIENDVNGEITNIYLVTKVTSIHFGNYNLTSIGISGIVFLNRGLVSHFYNYGLINVVLSGPNYFRIRLARSIYTNGDYYPYSELEHDNSVNGFTDLNFRVLTLSKHINITSEISFGRNFSGIEWGNNYLENSLHYTLQNKFEIGNINSEFHDLYNFSSHDFTTYLSGAYFETYNFQIGHFSLIENLHAEVNNFVTLTPLELSSQLLTNEFWTSNQLSEIDGFVLKFLTYIPFEFNNYSIQQIGTSYNVSNAYQVLVNGLALEPGTHYLNDSGSFLFTIINPLNKSKNFISVIVFSDSSELPSGSHLRSFTPQFGDGINATLNGELFIQGMTVDEPGDHLLIIEGENGHQVYYPFTIILVVTGIVNGGSYLGGINAEYSGGTATLNGNSYESGSPINAVGNHQLTIRGVNGFVKTIDFVVVPNKGQFPLQDGDTHFSGYTPNITGDDLSLTLNGEPYQSGTPIAMAGNYELSISGINNYIETIRFTIIVNFFNSVQDQFIYTNPVTPQFQGGTAKLNGQPFVSGTTVEDVGHYTLEIYGLNNLLKETISFDIKETLLNPQSGVLYSYTPNIQGGTSFELNGEPYSFGETITSPGSHTLKVFGINGYVSTYEFTISLNVGGLHNLVKSSNFIPTFSGGNASLNGHPFTSGDSVTNVGHYVLIVNGVGDFISRYEFTIIPLVSNPIDGTSYSEGITPSINGEGMTIFLNGRPINNINIPITNPGQNIIRIIGVGNYEKSITFNIIPTINVPVHQTQVINEPIQFTWTGGKAYLNGFSIENNFVWITGIGDYEFKIEGIDNEYFYSKNFTILPQIENLTPNEVYLGSVSPIILAPEALMFLNDEIYNGDTISSPGNHVLLIEGVGGYTLEIEFTVNLILTGLKNNATYVNRNTIISFSGGSALLNGAPIVSGHTTQDVGHHILIITGVNGFLQTYRFTNHANVNFETQSNDQYDGSFLPIITGENITLTLNGEAYSEERITLPGTHHLRIISPIGSYTRVYTFTIDLLTSDIEHNKIYSDWISPTFSGGMITLNGNDYQSGIRIESIGDFTLVVTGVNGFEETFVFTILPYLIDMPLPNSVQSSFALDINALHSLTQMTLNGIIYTESTPIVAIGHYDLLITFNGFPLVEHKFTIEPDDYLLSGSIIDTPFTLHYPHAEVLINDKTMTGAYRFDQQGTYVIEIKGVGEYYHTFTIEFINPNIDRMLLLLLPLAISMSLPLLAYGLRRRKVV